jgi:hypothetical protein
VKLKGWNPPRAALDVENRLPDFEKQIRTATHSNKLQKYNFTNLTYPQQQALNSLKHYNQLSNQTADTRVESVKSLLKKYFNSYKNQLSHPEITYFTRSF